MRYEKIGIDMGYDSVKIVAFRGESGTYGINAMETYNIEGQPLSSTYFTNLKKVIKSFLKDNKIKRAAFCFTISLSEGNTINQSITLPIMKTKFLKKSINFELEDMGILENLSEFYHKWDITDTDKKANKHEILILGIRRDIINQLSKIGSLKYRIEHIELQPATLGRMIEDTKLVLDFGQESTRLFYYKEGKPFLMKTISIAGKDIDEVIIRKKGETPREELARIKQQISIYERPKDENLDALEEEVREIVLDLTEEIKRYIRSIELQYEVYFDTIYYTGGMSNLLGLRDLISSELSVSFKPLGISNIAESSQLSQSEMSLFFFAISVAMYKDNPYLPNLHFTRLAKTQMDYSPVFITVVCASLIINIAAYDANGKYDKKIEELNGLSYAQSNVISLMDAELSENQIVLEKNQGFMDKINMLEGKNSWLSDILYVLTVETPEEVIVNSMKMQDGKISIKGFGKNYSAIAFISISLEKYGKVEIVSVDNEVSEEITSQNGHIMTRGFEITLEYEEGKRLIDDSFITEDMLYVFE